MVQTFFLYGDGACSGNPGPGGYAWDIYNAEPTQHEGQGLITGGEGGALHTTNNIMELSAAIAGLAHLLENGHANARVLMRFDSRYVLDGLFSWSKGWIKRGWRTASGDPVKNRELWEELLAQKAEFEAAGGELVSSWVKGHNGADGDVGNVRVDERAVAMSKTVTGSSVSPASAPAPKDIFFAPGDRAQHRKGGRYTVVRIFEYVNPGWSDEEMVGLSFMADGMLLNHAHPDAILQARAMVQMSTPVPAGARTDWVLYMPLEGALRCFLRPLSEFSDGRFTKTF